MSVSTRTDERRGVLLLVVLILLMMFALVGVTFVVVAGYYRRASESMTRDQQTGEHPRKLLDQTMYQLLRDTRDSTSALHNNSLLLDLYGTDSYTNQVSGVVPLGGGQLLRLHITTNPRLEDAQFEDYYNGCVITMLDGPAAGHSRRVVDFSLLGDPAANPPGPPYVTVEAFTFWPLPGNRFLINGRPFNGIGTGYSAEDGTMKWDANIAPELEALGLSFSQRNLSLLPRVAQRFGDVTDWIPDPITGEPVPADPLGAAWHDESWDAADLENLFLATPPNPDSRVTVYDLTADLPGSGGPRTPRPIPSFHRPFLINYWRNELAAMGLDPQQTQQALQIMLQYLSFRPLPWEHMRSDDGIALFTGSNPEFERIAMISDPDPQKAESMRFYQQLRVLIEGPWDVDNDGDGIADSVWIDPGFPVRRAPDGRLYRPLAAVLCLDLDGRVNLNAHGNLWHVAKDPTTFSDLAKMPIPTGGMVAGGVNAIQGLRGQGYGPAEINLEAVGIQPADYERLLIGGPNMLPSVIATSMTGAPTVPTDWASGRSGDRLDRHAGKPRWNDIWNDPRTSPFDYKTMDLGWRFGMVQPGPWNHYAQPSAYFSPPDFWGRGLVALNHFGQPIGFYQGIPSQVMIDPNAARPVAEWIDEVTDDPYEVNLVEPQASDQLFTEAELERLLRQFDADAQTLPARLLELAWTSLMDNPDKRFLFTTRSFDLRAPEFFPPGPNLRVWGRDRINPDDPSSIANRRLYRFSHLTTYLYWRLHPDVRKDPSFAKLQLQLMLPFEVRKGERMNVNRPWGDGRDNDGNLVVDEDTEFRVNPANPFAPPPNGDRAYINDDPIALGQLERFVAGNGPYERTMARQVYARHLFCMTMLLTYPENATFSRQQKELFARQVAQWAINVVDFRDADSIMTPFEYDLDIFNSDGWDIDIDGLPGTEENTAGTAPDRRIVWGCERPELLISENAAWHDRKTEDLDTEQPEQGEQRAKTDDPNNPDGDYDQRRLPEGAFFVELFNPWFNALQTNPVDHWTSYHKLPAELYAADPTNGQQLGIQLNRIAGGTSPVWRMIVAALPSPDMDPMDPDDPDSGFDRNLIDRSIYFVDLAALGFADPDGVPAFYPSLYANQPLLVMPGRYAVVGSAGRREGDRFISEIGERDPAKGDVQQVRRLVLQPVETDPNVPQVFVENNFTSLTPPSNSEVDPAEILPAVAVPIDRPRSLSISEPAEGYPALTDVKDLPLDLERAQADPALWGALQINGTTPAFRTVYLQRLANPLKPYDRLTNPYLTIDWMSVDLTAFSGTRDGLKEWEGPPGGQSREPGVQNKTVHFSTHQRGTAGVKTGLPRTLWHHEPPRTPADFAAESPREDTVPTNYVHYFPFPLQHTLGYLNTPYGPRRMPDPRLANDPFRGAPDTTAGPAFTWLTWNNRPYVSQQELLLVPKTSASQLLLNYRIPAQPGMQPYRDQPPANATEQSHMLDFFEILSGNQPSHYYRLLDFVEVPSRFIGTERWYQDAEFFSVPEFLPPFNRTSRFRSPGLININTIYHSSIWQAIAGPIGGNSWLKIEDSRRGYTPTTAADKPTLFMNPVRSAGGSELSTLDGSERVPIDSTLLRRILQSKTEPLIASKDVQPFSDASRNPYFRYQPLERLGNLVTTHSNVYAVWITLGYFEVHPVRDDKTGALVYLLGRELGSETGEIERHRGFYILDRSIPVGFQQGENLNVDDAVVLRRFIE